MMITKRWMDGKMQLYRYTKRRTTSSRGDERYEYNHTDKCGIRDI